MAIFALLSVNQASSAVHRKINRADLNHWASRSYDILQLYIDRGNIIQRGDKKEVVSEQKERFPFYEYEKHLSVEASLRL